MRQAVTDVMKEGKQPADLPQIDMDFVAVAAPPPASNHQIRDAELGRPPEGLGGAASTLRAWGGGPPPPWFPGGRGRGDKLGWRPIEIVDKASTFWTKVTTKAY